MKIFNKNTEIEFREEKIPLKTRKKRLYVRAILDGSILTNESVLKNIGYLIFLAALTMLYIANNMYVEKLVRKENQLKKITKELRAKQISKSFELMKSVQQSQVIKKISQSNLGLREATKPPYIIKITD
ncbi:MAG TPA: hypothetical protein EYP69_04040 [Bacteroidales bacterium]|nr:hypothetical protein [Bacteroidales bacterium]